MTSVEAHSTGSVRNWLEEPETHRRWIRKHYEKAALGFHEAAMEFVLGAVHPKDGSVVLDAGCGDGTHAIQLADRGFPVVGVDLAGSALALARSTLRERGLGDRIQIVTGDLTDLHFKNESFDTVLCWGVLMHIPPPGLERAIHELARILRKGGALVVSENNRGSLDSILHRILARVSQRKETELRSTPAGLEYWTRKPEGLCYLREDDLSWVTRQFEDRGLVLAKRVSALFTSAWTVAPFRPLKRLILRFNRLWFEVIRAPQLAHGNILIFRKPNPPSTA